MCEPWPVQPFLEVAQAIAEEAGERIREAAARTISFEHKGAIDLVTETDRAVEEFATERLRREFPDHLVVGEEASGAAIARPDEGQLAWYLDPLDGTTNFAHSFPQYSFSLGLARGSELILGVVHDPTRRETFAAEKGGGAVRNGDKVAVSRTGELAAALLGTGFPYDRREHVDFYLSFVREFILTTHGIRRGGSAALDLCAVACGRLDGFWEWKLRPWDTVAGVVIAREAGAVATDFLGRDFDPYGRQTLVSNGRIHDEMLAALSRVGAWGEGRGAGGGGATRGSFERGSG
jgi:myo-inositol-1(or 4)-monophosphatase